jgi:hypothetical protein
MVTEWRYEGFRSEMERLQHYFERAADHFPGLYHQLLWTAGAMNERKWFGFINANRTVDCPWEEWEVFPDFEGCCRFHGNKAGMEEFRRLANSGMLLLQARQGPGLQDACTVSMQTNPGYYGWLQLLYESAGHFATPMLRLDYHTWGQRGDASEVEMERLACACSMSSDGTEQFPTHPFVQTLQHDLFQSSAEAIRLWLEPNQGISVDISLCASPIILRASVENEADDVVDEEDIPPHWNKDQKELSWNGILIKRYTKPAKNQTLILDSFQELHWVHRVDDPLPGVQELVPKKRLSDTVEALNDMHINANLIRFRMDGTGEGVRWELVQPVPALTTP